MSQKREKYLVADAEVRVRRLYTTPRSGALKLAEMVYIVRHKYTVMRTSQPGQKLRLV